jgi:hypothetical protein
VGATRDMTWDLSKTRASSPGAPVWTGGSARTIGAPDGAAASSRLVASFRASGSGEGSNRERSRA